MIKAALRKAARAALLVQRATQSAIRYAGGARGPVVFRAVDNPSAYKDYVARQREKTLDRADKLRGPLWQEKIDGFRQLFSKYDRSVLGAKALCIGARTGQEVVVLRELGIDAIGVDLVAFPPHVVEGDMHALPFPDEEFDFVFSNCFDHSPMPKKMISEMERVCRGHIALWVLRGISTDYYAENVITDPRGVLALFADSDPVWAKADSTTFDALDFSILMRRRKHA